MSTINKITKETIENRMKEKTKVVTNFMGGNSFEVNPIDTLKMITASSIFGEPAYYRDGIQEGTKCIDKIFKSYDLFPEFENKKTSEIMTEAIDNALDYDFMETLKWAQTLREEFLMRLNPQIIMVRAAMHPKRVEFTSKNPGVFAEIQRKVMARGDESSSQLTYFLYENKSKNSCPNILKKTWSEHLGGLSRYELAKYKNANIGLIDTIRISHAHSEHITDLLRDNIELEQNEKTWENLRSEGKTWKEILATTKVGHMALLRNLRNIFKEEISTEDAKKILKKLTSGVESGKQFPFRYQSAYEVICDSNISHQTLVLDALQECVEKSLVNLPKLQGKTMCLSDNSGSAWGTFNSEYGKQTVATIGNLSSVITAKCSEEGYVGVFGDKLNIIPITKNDSVLTQSGKVNKEGKKVGASTENGIWIFFANAIKNKEHWDNIFIYSDMQAGHGGLYGINSKEYKDYRCRGFYIDVMKLISKYRSTVNPKVNVFCIQTAGYNNVLVPEYAYRCNILYGWTGKELKFADVMNKNWDNVEK